MKINEVEKLLEIPKATIRFYEKEGLLTPQRNKNSYREYSDADVQVLKKIIVLRKVGLAVDDIKQVLNNDFPLQDALSKNMTNLCEQMEEIKGAMKVCALMQQNYDEFGLLDEEGKIKFSLGKSIVIALGTCIAVGVLWFFLGGMKKEDFIEGFFFPFVCIAISSVLGLPIYFLEKKNEKAAKFIKKIGAGLGVLFLIIVMLMMLFFEV